MSSTTMLRSSVAVIVYGAAVGALVAYNVRWRYIGTTLFFGRKKARKLPVVKVQQGETKITAKQQQRRKDNVVVVLLHGMWHDASYFGPLQQLLAERGYTSYAISLLPGERLLPGGSQREIVADIEATLQDILPASCNDEKTTTFVLLGHSQGGLVAQSCLQNFSPMIRKRTAGIVLLGTFPLGGVRPDLDTLRAFWKQPTPNMYQNVLGYAYICLFGKLRNVQYAKEIFLLPSTDETTPEMSRYIQKLLQAPSDGLITMSHFFSFMRQSHVIHDSIPALVLGASHDIIYPPKLLTKAFQARFPHSNHIIAQNQAHCFVDPGWETSMAMPLMDWLDETIIAHKPTTATTASMATSSHYKSS